MKRDTSLNQYFTPTWAAELLVQKFFPELDRHSRVIEPSCGDGRFLMALPREVEAIGVDIDPTLADEARRNSGRDILTGDFCTIDLPFRPTAIIGNPPFESKVIHGFLERGYEEMDYGGKIGFILPVYFFQTASSVVSLSERFSLNQVLLPRNMFEQMQKPMMFATFTKERTRSMVGFFLYEETHAVNQLAKRYRLLFIGNQSRASLWGEVVEQALLDLGGEADLKDIYRVIEGNRPYTGNEFWKHQIRKIVQKTCIRTGPGRWRLMTYDDLADTGHQNDLFARAAA